MGRDIRRDEGGDREYDSDDNWGSRLSGWKEEEYRKSMNDSG